MESKDRLIMDIFRFVAVVIILFCSCSESSKSKTNIISQDSLVKIIIDMHLADAILLNPLVQSKISDVSSNKLYHSVLQKYNITKERFVESIKFYAENPVVLDSIYDKVIEQLNIIEIRGYKDSILK